MGNEVKEKIRKRRKKQKNKFIIWVEFVFFMIFWGFQRILPLKAAYCFNKMLFRLLLTLDRKHRNRTIQHLMHAGVADNEQAAWQLAKKNYRHLGQLAAETFKLDQLMTQENVNEVLKVNGTPETQKAVADPELKKPLILVTAHYGNWEIAGNGYAMKSGIPLVSIMRPFSNPLIGKYILRSREGANHQSFPKEGALKKLLKSLKDGNSVAILADQHAGSAEGVETVFFGQPCRTHMSPALLHLRTGIPILVSVTRRLDDDFHFEFATKELICYKPTGDKEADIRNVAQLYTTALEELIREKPEQWLWSHRRWLNINRRSHKLQQTSTT